MKNNKENNFEILADPCLLNDEDKQSALDCLNKNIIFNDYYLIEFWTNIFNDLFNGLQKIYWLRFEDVYSWGQFIDSQIKNINFKTFESSLIKKLWVKYVGNSSIYIDILAALSYIKYDFFNEICEKLKNK